jgi:glycerophosphoryl diester phosphodiesterase
MLEKFLSKPIAHRGLHSNDCNIPENSIPAFKKAIKLKLPIELDIQLTRDNHIVVFHDYKLQRICGLNKLIKKCTLEEIKELNLLNSDYKIPLLADVLELVQGKVPILIDIKNRNKAGKLEKLLVQELENYKGDIAIQSFNPFSIGWFAKNAPHIIRGQLHTDLKNKKLNQMTKLLLKEIVFNFFSRPHFIAMDKNCISKYIINKYKKLNTPILSWTIKNQTDYSKLKDACDNIIFENFIPDEVLG